MLYLYGSGSWENNRKIVKVGFTDDYEKRKQSYYLHNPLGKMLDSREVYEILELKLLLSLTDWKVEFLDEWFYDEEPVFKIFQETVEEIDMWLWENRSQVLIYPTIPPPETKKRKILDELRNKYSKTTTQEGTKLL